MRTLLFTLLAMVFMAVFAEAAPKKPGVSAHSRGDAYRLYGADINAMDAVDKALARAQENGTKALIVMGANWCHDSRGLAERFARPEFKLLLAEHYELAYVSVGTKPGQNDQNRAVSQRFGVEAIKGTPTVFIVTGDGQVLNGQSTGYWRNADSIPTDMSYAYFEYYAKKGDKNFRTAPNDSRPAR